MSKIVVIAGLAESLIRFRGDLLDAMRANGHEVIAIAPEDDDSVRKRLSQGYRILIALFSSQNSFEDIVAPSCLESLASNRALFH